MNAENKEPRKSRGNRRIAELGQATRFKPGQSGNPGGRPGWTPYADAHREVAELQVADLVVLPSDTVAVATAKAVASQALKGNISAAAEAANRAEGTPRPRPELGNRFEFVVQYEKPPTMIGTAPPATELQPNVDEDGEAK
jgi:hypothetical protein